MAVRARKYNHFIGIDVSRDVLDLVVLKGTAVLWQTRISNEQKAIGACLETIKKLPGLTITKAVFCLEAIGIYGNHLVNALKRLRANIVLENALQIKRSLGMTRGKTDGLDALRIARYAYKNRDELRLYLTPRPVISRLASLYTLRNRLARAQKSMKMPLREEKSFVKGTLSASCRRACKKTVAALKADLAALDTQMDELVRSDERLQLLNRLIISVPGVGRIAAIQLIVSTNEFLNITSARKFACYAGIAPFPTQSGNLRARARISGLANKKVKALLHVLAMSAICHPGELRAYYQRKVAEGKAKMLVLNAVRNKLMHRVFACVHRGSPYEKAYRPILPGAL